MPPDESTDQRIVRAMTESMRRQGYAATGVKQLAAAAQAPIGSVYHHFKGGKTEIASRALRESGAVYIQLVPLLLDPHDDLATGIEAAFATAAEDLEVNGWINMCPVGTVAGEVADAEPGLREVAADVIGSWVEQLTDYLTGRGLEGHQARQLAHAILASLEGAFVLARTQRSREPLLASGRALAGYVAALPAVHPR